MLRQIDIVARDPVLRMAAAGTLLFGSYVCSIGIYQSLIAINVIGLSEAAYAVIIVAAMATGVLTAVGVGIITDQRPSRRSMAIVAVSGSLVAALLVWLFPGKPAFIFAHAVLLPLGGTLFGQIFAVTRLASQHLSDSDRAGVMAVVRGVFAVPFVVLLPIWGLAADAGMSLLAIYPGIAAIAALHLLVILRHWPHDRTAPWVELKSGLRFRAALAEILTPPVLARVQLVGILQTGGALAGVLVGLCFDAAGRSTGQVGFFFSLFVGVEVLGTLLLGTLSARLARSRIILIGVLLYAVFLVGMPVLAAGPWIWAMAFFAGLGGALIYTPVIAYVQDLLGARAGAGASLLALGRIGQDGATAAAFGIGTFLGGYGLAGVLGAVFTCAAITAIIVLDRSRI